MVIEAADRHGSFTDLDEAAAIVYAVDHGARIINLSLGGPTTSSTERRAVDYAVAKGALLVAAIGNSHGGGNPVEYPAALSSPSARAVSADAVSRSGRRRSAVHARRSPTRARTSRSPRPAKASSAPSPRSSRIALSARQPSRRSAAGLYGYASGTSFAAPQVAGAAALVWAANPRLRASEVAAILKQHGLGRRKVEPAARLRRPRRRCGRGAGAGRRAGS